MKTETLQAKPIPKDSFVIEKVSVRVNGCLLYGLNLKENLFLLVGRSKSILIIKRLTQPFHFSKNWFLYVKSVLKQFLV